MGFISNQWLNRGSGSRVRGYRPVLVKIACKPASTQRPPGARVTITARKSDGEYQTVFLTQEEIDLVTEVLVSRVSPEAQERVLRKSLGVLSRARFLRVLAFDLRDRVRLPKK